MVHAALRGLREHHRRLWEFFTEQPRQTERQPGAVIVRPAAPPVPDPDPRWQQIAARAPHTPERAATALRAHLPPGVCAVSLVVSGDNGQSGQPAAVTLVAIQR